MHRLKKLPYKKQYKSIEIYQYLSDANFALGELKGLLDSSPYTEAIIRIINQNEAKQSCEIEGIKIDYDSLFKESVVQKKHIPQAHHIKNYMRSTKILFRDILYSNNITMSSLDSIQSLICPEEQGYRTLRGHKVYNTITHEVLHIPPQNKNAIKDYYENLEYYINNDIDSYDPLIKMAIIHYQFECIHPYKDGNGRIGRILNIMYLVNSKRLNYPILNLSKYLNETKREYYEVLSKSHNDINYLDEFIIYMLKGITETAKYTTNLIHQITRIINNTKKDIKKVLPKIYSEELVLTIFKYNYTKNEYIRNTLNLSRTTTTKYLKELVAHHFLEEERIGKETIYKNTQIKNILSDN